MTTTTNIASVIPLSSLTPRHVVASVRCRVIELTDQAPNLTKTGTMILCNGRPTKKFKAVVRDETSAIRVTFWNSNDAIFALMRLNGCVEIINVKVEPSGHRYNQYHDASLNFDPRYPGIAIRTIADLGRTVPSDFPLRTETQNLQPHVFENMSQTSSPQGTPL